MDTIFVEGLATVVAAVIVFCGSVFFLLSLVVGARLAYFITASVTLAFLSIMGVVWSVNPLGPLPLSLGRWIAVGTFVLFLAHLVGLSRLEKRRSGGAPAQEARGR